MSHTDPAGRLDSGADLFGRVDPAIVVCSALILAIAVSAIDKVTGYDLRLTALYLVPIAMVTWTTGRAWGLLLSVAAVCVWVAMFRGSHHYARNFFHYLDGATLLVTFGAVVLLLGRVRELLRHDDSRFADALDLIDGAAYVADPAQRMVLFGNRRFRENFAGWPFDKLEQAYRAGAQARARAIAWSDGRPVELRILPAP